MRSPWPALGRSATKTKNPSINVTSLLQIQIQTNYMFRPAMYPSSGWIVEEHKNGSVISDILCFWRDSPPQWARASSFTRFLVHTQRRTTVGRTPLDEWSARRGDLHLTTHNTHSKQTSISPVGFEPTTPASERPETHALDRAAIGTGVITDMRSEIYNKFTKFTKFTRNLQNLQQIYKKFTKFRKFTTNLQNLQRTQKHAQYFIRFPLGRRL